MTSSIVPQLDIFRHELFGKVRTIVLNGKPWFIGRDVAKALGYADPTKAVKAHCKRAVKYSNFRKPNDSNKGDLPSSESFIFLKPPYIIPEFDVYRLITRSKLEEAEKFEEWLYEVVLPSIRETGSYSINTEPKEVGPAIPFTKMLDEFKAAKGLALELGYDELLVTAIGMNAVKNGYGVDMVHLFGHPAQPSSRQEIRISPTEIGYRLNCSAVRANRILEAAGFQNLTRGMPVEGHQRGRIIWKITDEGKEYGQYEDVVIPGRTSTVQRIRWREGVVPVLKKKLEEGLKIRRDKRGKDILTLVGKGHKKTMGEVRPIRGSSSNSEKSKN